VDNAQTNIGIGNVHDYQRFKWAVDVENPKFFVLGEIFLLAVYFFTIWTDASESFFFLELCKVISLILVEMKGRFINYWLKNK
jgi:hypothetical protein